MTLEEEYTKNGWKWIGYEEIKIEYSLIFEKVLMIKNKDKAGFEGMV